MQQRAVEAQVLEDQLHEALERRIVVEQAKGIVAEQEGLDVEQALAALRTHARTHHQRLADVAAAVVDGHPRRRRARRRADALTR